GEFCTLSLDATPGNGLSVLFAIDHSASMLNVDPGNGFSTCGRLEAGQTLVSSLEQQIQALSNTGANPAGVQVGLVTFGNTGKVVTQFTPLESFKSSLTFDNFCGDPNIIRYYCTNYDDAFQKAKDAFQGVAGAKVLYHLSDGLPSMSGAGL